MYQADPIFLTLGDGFSDDVVAADFPNHIIRFRNDKAAKTVGLESLSDQAWINHFGRFTPLDNNMMQPQALRYHGHQFRHYNPDIGDGRGFLFAQMRDGQGRLLDLGTKGSGTTPYSRSGDGRLTLKGGVREILATELLEALGVETSRSFSLIETGEALERNDEPSPTRSAVLVRLSHSHIRIGTFQRLAFYQEKDKIIQLMYYVLQHYFGQKIHDDTQKNAATFLDYVCKSTAKLTADMLAAGFVHGVLNTDNINVTGENFDYGPWRFLPTLDPSFTAAYFDHTGLYAYGRQPEALHWNVYQLAGCLQDLLPKQQLNDILQQWQTYFTTALRQAYFRRLGLKPKNPKQDDQFLNQLLGWMVNSQCPFENLFYDWYGGAISQQRAMQSEHSVYYQSSDFQEIETLMGAYQSAQSVNLDHSYFQQGKACTLLIDEVEMLWDAIDQRDDWQPFYDKIDVIRSMSQALNS